MVVGKTGLSEVSLTVTVELVATIVPEVDPVLTCSWKLSDPSVVPSFANVSATDPEPLLILKEPVTAAPVKSDVLIVPETVFKDQYKVVPSETLEVVTVNVTLEPSFTEEVDGDTVYLSPDPKRSAIIADILTQSRSRNYKCVCGYT